MKSDGKKKPRLKEKFIILYLPQMEGMHIYLMFGC